MNYPKNWGQCFDAAGVAMLSAPAGARLCHGIGEANAPGQQGHATGHAWIEYAGNAYDCVWQVKQEAAIYRANLKLSYVIEYRRLKCGGIG